MQHQLQDVKSHTIQAKRLHRLLSLTPSMLFHHYEALVLILHPRLTTPWKPEPEDGFAQLDKSGEKLTDSAKLKGIIWPGMDLFDSATPELKRMRNQKKDGSILEQMMATSRGVEPAEVSYHSNGEFRASRDIFGPLSTENSPVCVLSLSSWLCFLAPH